MNRKKKNQWIRGASKKRIALASIFVLLSLLLLGARSITSVERDADKTYELVILHTNDHHGSIETKDKLAGLSRRATYIKSVRSEHENVLLVDAGDINTGQAISNLFKAKPDIEAYNALQYDALAFGNHEFDNTLSVLNKQIKQAKFAWLGANIKRSNGKYLDKPYLVKNYEGFRVGIFGLTTNRTIVSASPDASLQFADEIESARQMVSLLRNDEKVDIVIALTHLGTVVESLENKNTTSQDIAKSVEGIDVIIDGHSHTKMDIPLMVNKVPIVSAWEWGKNVGNASLKIRNGKIIGFDWQPILITQDAFAADPQMDELLSPYLAKASKQLDKVIGETLQEFEFINRPSRYREHAFANLSNDATTWFVRTKLKKNVDFTIINGGNIRASLSQGKIKIKDIATIMPFDNWLYLLTLNGSDLIEFFDFVATINQGGGGFAQFSKEVTLSISYDKEGKNGKLNEVLINGKPIERDKKYVMGVNEYLANGGDGYTVLKKAIDSYNTSFNQRDIVVEYIQQLQQPLSPKNFIDGRLIILGGIQ
ncbi:MAG: bifunctional metallophosphatase/5'-nucleotidase [Treponemataceae bacterium]